MHTLLQRTTPVSIPWKDYECDYCRALVMVCADKNVPEESILSYLNTQIVSARQDKDYTALHYLRTLRLYWIESPRYLALIEEAKEAQRQADFEEECLSRRQGW